MQPKTTTIPIIENIEYHPRKLREWFATPASTALAAAPECAGFIFSKSDFRSSPGPATAYVTSALTRKRSPHHNTSEWLSSCRSVSAVLAMVTGLPEDRTARNSQSPQQPRKFSDSRLCRNV